MADSSLTAVSVIWQRGTKKVETGRRKLVNGVAQIDEKYQITTIFEVNESQELKPKIVRH